MADYSDNRVVKWKNGATSVPIVADGNEPGNRNDQLNGPANVINNRQSDSRIVCDYDNERVGRWPYPDGTSGEIIISNIYRWGLGNG